MRFLTVEELVARKDCNLWSKEWIGRVVAINQSARSTVIDIDELSVIYNEGTLLLYRMGLLGLARRACSRGVRARRSSCGQGLATFAVQQWINLSRLDVVAGRPKRCERRLRHLEASLERLIGALSPDDIRKTRIVCLVERAALLLSRVDLPAICSLKRVVPGSIKSEVEACMIESEIRCLIKMGSLVRAQDVVTRGLLAFNDHRILGALLVLLATLRPLTRDEADLLLLVMSRQIAERPIHYVQVGEFLLRKALPENRICLAALIEPLLASSIRVGDVVASRFLAELCHAAPQLQKYRTMLRPSPCSSSPLPDAASVIAEQLDLLLSRVGRDERLHA